MRKLLLAALFFGALIKVDLVQAQQVKVASNGYVGILSSGTPLSPLSIGCNGVNSQKVAITGETMGLYSLRTGTGSGDWYHAISGDNNVVDMKWNVGVRGNASTGIIIGGRAFGVLGTAGNATSGYNYGVFGSLTGSGNGAGVVGSIDYNLGSSIQGKYAGYFYGNVLSTGTMSASSYITTSDKRLKKNIATIDKSNALNGLLSLNPVEYNLIPRTHKSKGDSASIEVADADEKSQAFQKKHFGLIAQELKAIYPDLVYEDSEGYLAINYTGIIPLLIQSVKELKEELNTKVTLNTSAADLKSVVSTSATVSYSLNNNVTSASVIIFDMQGKLLKSIPVTGRGKGSVLISDVPFTPGMYIYSIVADGSEVESKRLVLTN